VRLLQLQTKEPAAGSADSRQLKGVTVYAVTTVKSVDFFQYRNGSFDIRKSPASITQGMGSKRYHPSYRTLKRDSIEVNCAPLRARLSVPGYERLTVCIA